MKPLLLAVALGVELAACTTTTTYDPVTGKKTSQTIRQDPKVIKELEPLVEKVGEGAVQGALDYIQTRAQSK